nr:MAG TPA: capsid assembly protein [Caudoviricetes sp.]
MSDKKNVDSAFVQDDELYNNKIKSEVVPDRKRDIDLDKTLYSNIIGAAASSQFDINSFNSLSQTATNRNELYNMIDSMCEDGTISAVVETYAEDATERNENGDIVWVESSRPEVAKYVEFLLDSLNVNKNIFKWTYSLCRYGDVYLRLYRESDYDDELFNNNKKNNELNENLKIIDYKKSDRYATYMEMVANPAEMFELTRLGKTVGYVKAPIQGGTIKKDDLTQYMNFVYNFKQQDLELYPATEFVHAALEDDIGREEETVNIYLNNKDYESQLNAKTYKVRRGNSLLSNIFKIWRELNLLQTSVLLNRLTKSSIVRMINIEVGDMPKENVTKVLMDVKRLIEQKSAINKNTGMAEYTNPGPIENNVYIPTHEGKGAVTTSQIGGDVDVKSLADLDYYQNLLYGALRVPKQFFAQTDDSTGFNGGSSLSIISSRYAKMIKRIQTTMIQAITDAINLLLIDKQLDSYVNEFKIHMLIPVTQEEIDRRDNLSNKVQLTSDIMNMLSDIEDTGSKLKILKVLLKNIVDDNEVIEIIQKEIDKLEQENSEEVDLEDDNDYLEDEMSSTREPKMSFDNSPKQDLNDTILPQEGSPKTLETNDNEVALSDDKLPSPIELGVDMNDTQ